MTITQLHYFLLLSKQLNFTRTAKQLFISQSTLSQHISKLENELGVTLFQRGGSGVSLTPEGKYLYTVAGVLLDELDSLPQSLAEVHRISRQMEIPEKFSIGVDSQAFSMNANLTEKFVFAVQNISNEFHDVEIIVQDIPTKNMFQHLLDKTIDVVVGSSNSTRTPHITSMQIFKQQMNLVTKMRPEWEHTTLNSEAIVKYILNNQDVYTVIFDELHHLRTQKWIEEMGGTSILKPSSSPWIMLLQLQLGNIAAIVPTNRFDMGFNFQNMYIFPIDEISIPRYVSWRSENNHPLLQQFIELFT